MRAHLLRVDRGRLRAIKLLHTVIWAFFAGSIVAIPFFAWAEHYPVATVLSGLVFIECVVVLVNGWRCPLTDIAARYTSDRRDNFDIYLPERLARHNKTIFGALYMAGLLVLLARWVGWLG